MGYKIITMKRQLLLYLIKLFVGIVVIIICWLALTNIFVECGVIIPANYSETILEENRKRLDDIQQIRDLGQNFLGHIYSQSSAMYQP